MESIHKNLKPVNSTLPVAPYLGGKRVLAKRIITKINRVPHTLYAEPFVGMGGVFLRRKHRPKSEAINDYSKDISNLFRILQRHYPQFMDTIKYQITSRAEFSRLVDCAPDTLTDLERAARFLYLQRTTFGGNPSGHNFGVAPGYPARFDISKLAGMLEDVHERLSGVTIECLPYGEFITRYDREKTLFYLDPPYFNCENDYGKDMFERADFERLAIQLQNIDGRFIMSINDVPEIRALFAAFTIEQVETTYSINKKSSKRVGELIISN
jgi:DNA adenine methylase